jgi:lysozyme family protein
MTEGVDSFVESYAAGRAGWASRGAIAAAVAVILAGVYAVEGGYVNDARDPGGATSYGVTEQVARDYGYRGDMRRFPQHCDGPATICADAVYVRSYIAAPGYMPLVEIEPAVAGELIDTAVNMGPRRPNRWYRLTMNALGEAHLPDGTAPLGPIDVAAYRMLQAKLGVIPACTATLDALDARQAAEYRRLATANPKLRAFLKGWLRNRIGNADRRSCGKGDG